MNREYFQNCKTQGNGFGQLPPLEGKKVNYHDEHPEGMVQFGQSWVHMHTCNLYIVHQRAYSSWYCFCVEHIVLQGAAGVTL